MKTKAYSITINGDRWKYQLLDEATFRARAPEAPDAVAYTQASSKLIVFSPAGVGFSYVFHELFHAYCHYLYLNSAAIEHEQFEEIVAEMLGEKVLTMLEQTRKMLERLGGKDAAKPKGLAKGSTRVSGGEGLVRQPEDSAGVPYVDGLRAGGSDGGSESRPPNKRE